jgi:hypothetical protein
MQIFLYKLKPLLRNIGERSKNISNSSLYIGMRTFFLVVQRRLV